MNVPKIFACRKDPGPCLIVDNILFVHAERCWLHVVPATQKGFENSNFKRKLSLVLRCKKLRVGRTKQIVHHLSEMSLSEIHMSYLLQVYWINRMNRIGNMQSNLQLHSVSSEVVNKDEKKRIVSISRGARCKQNYNLVLISSFMPYITVSHYHYLLTLSIAMI